MRKLSLLLCALTITLSHAATLHKMEFAEQIKVDGKTLELNGLGARLATFFKVKVYVAGLYLEKKSMNPKSIIDSVETKKLVMKFLRSVDAQKLKDAWKESLLKNVKDINKFKNELKAFNDAMVDVEKKDVMTILFKPSGVVLTMKGKALPEIQNAGFSQALLSIWLKNPPNDELKEGLLGKIIE